MDTPRIVILVVAAFGVLAIGRMAWRIFVRNEEMQSGGSMGNQMFGRTRRKKRDQI